MEEVVAMPLGGPCPCRRAGKNRGNRRGGGAACPRDHRVLSLAQPTDPRSRLPATLSSHTPVSAWVCLEPKQSDSSEEAHDHWLDRSRSDDTGLGGVGADMRRA